MHIGQSELQAQETFLANRIDPGPPNQSTAVPSAFPAATNSERKPQLQLGKLRCRVQLVGRW